MLSWIPVATASASIVCVTETPWSARASAVEPSLSRLALTAASIGATTLALRAIARSIGAAPSIARSTSAARSRIDMTSLSGSAVIPSLATSSGVRGARSSVLILLPPMGCENSWLAATVISVSPRL